MTTRRGRMTTSFICLLFFLLVLPNWTTASDFAKDKIVHKIEAHSVAIAVYYTTTDAGLKGYWKQFVRGNRKTPAQVTILGQEGDDYRYVVFLGSGTVLRNNYVITVRHLFDHIAYALEMRVFVFFKEPTRGVLAELTCVSTSYEAHKDYAILKIQEDQCLPGIKISKKDARLGDKACYIGSTNGLAFNTRFGYIGENQYYFRQGGEGALHLSHWEVFPFFTVTPGGAGDSGGGIFNTKGELVGMMYCGVTAASEEYIFSNPISFLWEFLQSQGMEWLGK